ncbi:hypothetical protein [Streptomyces sp. NPDC056921]|uniref:hypothetical protein n=1 Tax=Streptomyces sp. NPDC056921 TaxID=3345966 RepID=UPI00362CF771
MAWYTLFLGIAAMVTWYRFAVPVRRGLCQHLRLSAVRPDEPRQFLREAEVPARHIHHESFMV